ncbi:MAG: hypothetical protein KC502_00495 [Myxococcales bacterium]|nr:hypothetical protein [Myxococcales bacterium]
MPPPDTGANHGRTPLVDTLTGGRLGAPLLMALWALLLWTGTQVPQADAPLSHSDALARADLLSLVGLGLHRIAGSLPAWLLVAATAVMAVARMAAPNLVATTAVNSDGLMQRLSGLDHRFRQRTPTTLTLGHGTLGRRFLAAGTLLVVVGWLLGGMTPAPVVIQTDAKGAVAAYRIDGGRAGKSAAITGRCAPQADGLACTLAGPGVAAQATVAPGVPAHVGSRKLTWVARAAAPTATHGALRWRRSVNNQKPTWYGFELPVGAAVQIPALDARAVLVDGAHAGPLIAASVGGKALLAASPGLISGPAMMRLDSPSRAQLLLSDPISPWWWRAGMILLLLGLILVAALPAVEVILVDSQATVVHCNQAALRRSIERAFEASAEES